MAFSSLLARYVQAPNCTSNDTSDLERIGSLAMRAGGAKARPGLEHSALPAIAPPRRGSRRDPDMVQLNVYVPRAVRDELKAIAARRGVGLGSMVSSVLGRFCQRQRQ